MGSSTRATGLQGRLLIDPGMDAFLAYLRTDPAVHDHPRRGDSRSMAIGRSTSPSSSARTYRAVLGLRRRPVEQVGGLTWVPAGRAEPRAFWNGELGSAGMRAVTEVDGVTLVFESVNVDHGAGQRRPRGARHRPLPRRPARASAELT